MKNFFAVLVTTCTAEKERRTIWQNYINYSVATRFICMLVYHNYVYRTDMSQSPIFFVIVLAIFAPQKCSLSQLDSRCVMDVLLTGTGQITCTNITLPDYKLNRIVRSYSNVTSFHLRNSQIRSNFYPISYFPDLEQVEMDNLKYHDNHGSIARLPFNRLLLDVKYTIQFLSMTRCNLRYLKASDFVSFYNLQKLRLWYNNIETVDSGTFEALQWDPRIRNQIVSHETKLRDLDLRFNKIKRFDSSVFIPIAAGIQDINMANNTMEIFISSQPMGNTNFPELKFISLADNNLTEVPLEIFSIIFFTSTNLAKFNTKNNPFCCDCCNFIQFMTLVQDQRNTTNFSALTGSCTFSSNGTKISFQSRLKSPIPPTAPDCKEISQTPGRNSPTCPTFTENYVIGTGTIGIVIGSLFTALVFSACLVLSRRRKRKRKAKAEGDQEVPKMKTKRKPFFTPELLDSIRKFIKCPWLNLPSFPFSKYPVKTNHEMNDKSLASFMVPKWRITILHGSVLGVGYFGKVFLGELQLSQGYQIKLSEQNSYRGNSQLVAVKTLKNVDNANFREELYAEMRIMIRIGQHANVVNLLGMHHEDEIGLILEYCSNGPLDKFLKKTQSQLTALGKLVQKTKLRDYRKMSVGEATIQANSIEPDEPVVKVVSDINEARLMAFCYETCRGIAYISSLGIVHRDLAARNILLDSTLTAKVADFGMAREDAEYVLERLNVPLPVKWMAPESIKNNAFSMKSDVWSFGIVIWETFSFGDHPYSGMSHGTGPTNAFWEYLKRGCRLPRPPQIPDKMYQLMVSCWSWNPEDRSSFAELLGLIEELVSPEIRQNYVTVSESGA